MLNACLIPSYGAVGASMATVAAEAIEFIVMSKYITRYMKLSFVFENTHHYLIAVAPVAIAAIITLSVRNMVLGIVVGVCHLRSNLCWYVNADKEQIFQKRLICVKVNC